MLLAQVQGECAMSRDLTGLVALVAGGGSGIGAQTALTLAAQGALVAVTDRRSDAAQNIAAKIAGLGGKAVGFGLDVSQQADIDAGLEKVLASFGKLDILVNSAGAAFLGALETCTPEDWRSGFAINVDGALFLARSCLPELRKSPDAAIVNVSSVAGTTAYPNGGSYGPSKAALISLSRQMAMEWAKDRVRVNVVNPGTTDTPMVRSFQGEAGMAARAAQIPLGRLGHVGDIANLIVFLASPSASYITGQAINCDGGVSQTLIRQALPGRDQG